MTKMKISKILCYTASIGLAACLAQNATAQTDIWLDTDVNGLWSDVNNWSLGAVPNSATATVIVDPQQGQSCTIPAAYAADAGSVALSMFFGPEWGQTFNVYGSCALGWALCPVQNWPNYGLRSTINMYNGSSMWVPANGAALALGCNWWWTGGPYVTMNMSGNAQFSSLGTAGTWFGGHLNIYDTASCLFNNYVNIEVNDGAQIDLNDSMNICGGTLLLPEGWMAGSGEYNGTTTGSTTDLINRGILRAYGKVGAPAAADLVITDNAINTIITTVPLGGGLTGIRFEALNEAMAPVGSQQALVLVGDYPSVTGVLLSSPEPGVDLATLPGTPVYSSSDTCVVTVDANGVATSVGAGDATITATVGSFTATIPFNVPHKATPIHRYSFNGPGPTVPDSITGNPSFAATLVGGAVLGGGQVTLDGSTGYVELPAGILTGFHDVTIETWASFGSPINTWAGLFAFGTDDNWGDANNGTGGDCIAFQPRTGTTNSRAEFQQGLPGNGDEMDAVWATPLDGLTNAHVVAVYAPSSGYISFYVNGALEASMPANFANQLYNSLIDPGAFAANGSILDYTLNTRGIFDQGVNESIADPDNFIGRDDWGNDPFLNGSIAEFRIYNTALTASQISADYVLGPTQLIGANTSVSLTSSLDGLGNILLSWPKNSFYVTLVSSTSLPGGCWAPVSNGTLAIVGANYVETVPLAGTAQFFGLQ